MLRRIGPWLFAGVFAGVLYALNTRHYSWTYTAITTVLLLVAVAIKLVADARRSGRSDPGKGGSEADPVEGDL